MTDQEIQTQAAVIDLLDKICDSYNRHPENVDKTKGIDFGDVVAYEMAKFDTLDDKGKPTGETYDAPMVTLTSGKEIQLTEQENLIFRPYWNKKCQVFAYRRAYADRAFDNIQNQTAQLAASPANG